MKPFKILSFLLLVFVTFGCGDNADIDPKDDDNKVTEIDPLATIRPPQYETFKPPVAGEWFTDLEFGTRIKRLTDEQNILGWNGERAMFSAQDKYFAIAINSPYKLRLFDGKTGDFLRDLPVSVGDNSEFRWSYDPQVLVYPKDNRLMGYNVVTDVQTILGEFSDNIGNNKGRLCGGDGNDFDDKGEWLLLNIDKLYFAYNILTGEKGPEKDMTDYGKIDYCTISPSGQYIVGTGETIGKKIWNRDWTNERTLVTGNAHFDMGYLNGTEECLVTSGGGGIQAIRFSDLKSFMILQGSGLGSMQFSAVGGSNKQHVYIAFEDRGLNPDVEWRRYLAELVQVPLVTTGPGEIRRLAHHRARTTDGSEHNFQDQPELWINHAGDRLFFRSNMDNFTAEGKHDLYMIELDL
ncbi:hypothetical protein [Mariniflexile sp.]|uniref:hypothetical protein n=2 Tax=Mariniflexile sp. TaxID=1979402 RepID=UPI004048E7E4